MMSESTAFPLKMVQTALQRFHSQHAALSMTRTMRIDWWIYVGNWLVNVNEARSIPWWFSGSSIIQTRGGGIDAFVWYNITSPLPLVKDLSSKGISYSVRRVFSKVNDEQQSPAVEVEGLVPHEESVSRVSSRIDASDECAEAILLPDQINFSSLQSSGQSTPLGGVGYFLRTTKTFLVMMIHRCISLPPWLEVATLLLGRWKAKRLVQRMGSTFEKWFIFYLLRLWQRWKEEEALLDSDDYCSHCVVLVVGCCCWSSVHVEARVVRSWWH